MKYILDTKLDSNDFIGGADLASGKDQTMIIDITKPVHVRDKEDGKIYLVDGLYFPLGKASGKDITIENAEEGISEWRSIEDVEFMRE